MRILTAYLTVTACAMSLTACSSDGGTTPTESPATPATIELSTARLTLTWIGDTDTVNAVVRDQNGQPIPQALISWSSANLAVVHVEATTGAVVATGNGTARLTASAGSVQTSVAVVVDQVASHLELDRPSAKLILGNVVQLHVTATDQGGTPMAERPTWEASGSELEVDTLGLVRTVTGGGLVIARMDGVADTAIIETRNSTVHAMGRIAAPAVSAAGTQNSSGAIRMLASVVTPTDTLHALVGVDGTYRVGLDTTPTSGSLAVDALDPTDRVYHPVWISLDSGTDLSALSALLVPLEFRIPVGNFAGTTVPISMEDAFTKAGDGTVYLRPVDTYCYSAPAPVVIQREEATVPLRFAISHTRSTRALTAADSILLWDVLNEIEADYGRNFFEPAMEHEVPYSYPGYASQGVDYRLDETLTIGGFAGFGCSTPDGYLQNSGIGSVVHEDSSFFRFVIHHEIGHILGLGHTSALESVMGSADSTSRYDVAYYHFTQVANDLIRSEGLVHTYEAARNGERVLMRGLEPLDRCWRGLRCGNLTFPETLGWGVIGRPGAGTLDTAPFAPFDFRR